MRSVRPTDDSSVSCRDSLATRESSLQVPSASAVRCWLSPFLPLLFLFSLSFSLSLYLSVFAFCRSFTRTKSRSRRSRACDASLFALLRYCFPEPAACVLRLWRSRGSAAEDSIFRHIGDRYRTHAGLNTRYEIVVRVVLQRLNRGNLNRYTRHW